MFVHDMQLLCTSLWIIELAQSFLLQLLVFCVPIRFFVFELRSDLFFMGHYVKQSILMSLKYGKMHCISSLPEWEGSTFNLFVCAHLTCGRALFLESGGRIKFIQLTTLFLILYLQRPRRRKANGSFDVRTRPGD